MTSSAFADDGVTQSAEPKKTNEQFNDSPIILVTEIQEDLRIDKRVAVWYIC